MLCKYKYILFIGIGVGIGGLFINLSMFGCKEYSCQPCLEAHELLDSQNFLVRQRRNRVWGAAVVNTGSQAENQFQERFKTALQAMQTHCHFTMEESFKDFGQEEPRTSREAELLAMAQEKAKLDSCLANIYIYLYPNPSETVKI